MALSRRQLFGASKHVLDDKFRFIVPKRLSGVLGQDGEIFYLTAHHDGCVLMIDDRAFQKLSERVAGDDLEGSLLLDESRERDLARLLLGHAEEVRPDKSGRVLIPESLRSFLGITESERDVIAVGAGSRIELWSPPKWKARLEATLASSLNCQTRVTQPVV